MIRNIAFIIASILSLKTMALRCESLFDRTLPQKTSTRSALEKYKVNNVTLEKISARLPEARLKHLEHLVAATEFFDYAHFSEKLLDVYLKNENKKVNLSRLYDEGGFLVSDSKPFQGFLNARKFLATQTREPSIDLIKDIHRIVMAGEVEGVSELDEHVE